MRRHVADLLHWFLWNFTPPEFAHVFTIKLLKIQENFWLRPVNRFWAGWRAFWLEAMNNAQARIDKEKKKDGRR